MEGQKDASDFVQLVLYVYIIYMTSLIDNLLDIL